MQKLVKKLKLSLVKTFPYKGMFIVGTAIIVVVGIIYVFNRPVIVEAGWYNDGWAYRQIIAVSNSGAAQTNTQVKILSNTNLDSLTPNKLQADLDDLRFTDINGNLLKYWIEDATNTSVDVWAFIDYVPATGVNIYMYYGNPSVTSGVTALGSADYPGVSCEAINKSSTTVDGLYYIDPDGEEFTDKFQVYCDLNTANGGWTLVHIATNTDATNVALRTTFDNPPSGFKDVALAAAGEDYFSQAYIDLTADDLMFVVQRNNFALFDVSDAYASYFDGIFSSYTNWHDLYIQNPGSGPLTTGINPTTGTAVSGRGKDPCAIMEWNNGCGGDDDNYISFLPYNSNDSSSSCGDYQAYTFSNDNTEHFGIPLLTSGGAIEEDDVEWHSPACQPLSTHGEGTWGWESSGVDDRKFWIQMWTREDVISTTGHTITSSSPTSEEKGPGPIAYWKFDEGYGTITQDITTNNNDGTISGATWQAEDICVIGKCLYFDGLDDYINIPDSTDFTTRLQTGLTMTAWIKPSSSGEGGYGRVFSKATDTSGAAGFYLRLDSASKRLAVRVNSGSTIYSASNSIVHGNGSWYYAVATINSSGLVTFYINGIQSGTSASTSGLSGITTSSPLRIGNASSGTTNTFDGFIDEPKIYNYVRTASQVKADYLAGQTGSPAGVGVSFGGDQQQTNSEGLVGYWKMDEASGNIADSSGNGFTGTVTGTTVTAGKYGNGRSFNGTSSDYITITDTTALKPTTAITAEIWFTTTNNTTAGQRMLSKTEGSGYQLSINENSACPSNTLCFLAYVNGAYRAASYASSNIDNNQWYHIAGTFDGNKGMLYLDGVEVGSFTQTGTIATSTVPLCVGAEASTTCSGGYHSGKIDEVKIYNIARTAEQIMRDYKRGPGPVGWYRFEEGAGTTTTYDGSGYGNNATLNNMSESDWILGKYGSALNYDGTTGQGVFLMNHATADVYQSNLDNTTISFWFKANNMITGDNNARLISRDCSDYFCLEIDQSGADAGLGIIPADGETAVWYTFNNQTDWHHTSLVWDVSNTNFKMYLDGILLHEDVSLGSFLTTTRPIVLGGNTEGDGDISGDEFIGYIDEVKIYNYVRTPEQILWDMYGDNSNHPFIYYNFDEGYGTTVHDLGLKGLNSSIVGAVWQDNGQLSRSLYFDGTDDRVDISDPSYPASWSDAFSLVTWVNIPSSATWHNGYNGNIIGRGSYDGSHGLIRTTNNNQVSMYVRGGSSVAASAYITRDEWYHLVGVWDGNKVRLYINGKYEAQAGPITQATPPDSGSWRISSQIAFGGAQGNYFNGNQDEVKIFNFALSSEQVRQEYTSGAQVSLGKQKESAETWNAGGFGGNAPMAYWNFEEGSGTNAQDVSANSNTGVITNATYTLGKLGWGLDFDGSGDYVDTGAGIKPASAITMEAWVKPRTVDGAIHNVIDHHSGYEFQERDDSFWRTYINLSSSSWQSAICSTITVQENQWYFVSGTYDSSTGIIKTYVDGNLCVSTSGFIGETIAYAAPDETYIGSQNDGTNRMFDGVIDEVKIFDYARTQAQIAYDYNGGKPVGWWPLDDAEGITAIDISGNDNSGTLTTMDPPNDWLDGTSCKFQGCLDFDGTDDWLDLGNIGDPSVGSISLWLKKTDFNAGTQYVLDGRGTGNWWFLQDYVSGACVDSTGNLCFNGLVEITSSLLSNNTWHHVVVALSSTDSKIYHNGVLIDTGGVLDPDFRSVRVATRYTNVNYFIGQMDDIRIYNYALSADQVKEVMNYGSTYIK